MNDLQTADGEEDEEFEGSSEAESDSDSGSDAELIAEDGISAEAVTGPRPPLQMFRFWIGRDSHAKFAVLAKEYDCNLQIC
jgi:hypothetical protein